VSSACAALVIVGAAVQVAVGARLSVVCGAFLLLWLGAPVGVPVLLCLNLNRIARSRCANMLVPL
jgi:hypothetical protein